jgi:hypothetical protein
VTKNARENAVLKTALALACAKLEAISPLAGNTLTDIGTAAFIAQAELLIPA